MIYSYTGSKARTKNYNYRFLISHLQGFPYWRDGGGGGGGGGPHESAIAPIGLSYMLQLYLLKKALH